MRNEDLRLGELAASEERLQAFMRHSPVLAFMKDAEGRYVYVNPRMETTFGVRLADITGKADADWLPPDVAEKVAENDRQVLRTQQPIELIEAVPTPDGTLRYWMVIKFPFTQADGQQFVGGVAVDVTEQRATEDILRRRELDLRTLLENTPDVVARFDRDLRHVYVNRAAQVVRHLPAERIVGRTLEEIGAPPAQREILEANLREVFQTGKGTTFEATGETPVGLAYHLVRLTPEFGESRDVHTVLVTSRDITRLKQTEKRLVESERRYRRIFESGLGLICTHDLEGRLLSVNAAAAHSLGYEPADLAGVQLRDHLAPEVRDQFDAYLARIRRNGTDAGLMLVLDRQGQTRTWKYHNALLSETGAPDYVLGHAQDVTALKHAQEIAESLSFTDDLTGLYNRRGFFALAEQHLKLARAPRTKKGTLLVYTDMDGLKAINDAHGHDQGSRALVAVAELLRRTFRESDILARLGGDEFVILSISATDQDERAIRDRLEAALQEYNAARLHPFVLSLSVGTAVVDSERRRSLDELLKAADEQMYEEKRRKKV